MVPVVPVPVSSKTLNNLPFVDRRDGESDLINGRRVLISTSIPVPIPIIITFLSRYKPSKVPKGIDTIPPLPYNQQYQQQHLHLHHQHQQHQRRRTFHRRMVSLVVLMIAFTINLLIANSNNSYRKVAFIHCVSAYTVPVSLHPIITFMSKFPQSAASRQSHTNSIASSLTYLSTLQQQQQRNMITNRRNQYTTKSFSLHDTSRIEPVTVAAVVDDVDQVILPTSTSSSPTVVDSQQSTIASTISLENTTTTYTNGRISVPSIDQGTAMTTASRTDTSDVWTSSTSTIITDDIDFIRPDRDLRSYRYIRLSNNLYCLLICDNMQSGVGIEAASIHVQAGHFDDTIPGLART
jgi:hypothetical protein